ncbi:MAG: hypothetical protein AAF268_15200 [Cyanobacteria bacterium P01_A01_bin.3]
MVNLQEKTAAYYRLGLQLGTHTVDDVISWVDRQIELLDSPSSDLIDLSLMSKSHPLDVLGMLDRLDGDVAQLDVLSAVLADAHTLLREEGDFGPTLARGLRNLYVECGYDVPELFRPICWFDEYYALAQLGLLGTEEEIYQELLAFTASFRELDTTELNT